jgi:hypothetical protein
MSTSPRRSISQEVRALRSAHAPPAADATAQTRRSWTWRADCKQRSRLQVRISSPPVNAHRQTERRVALPAPAADGSLWRCGRTHALRELDKASRRLAALPLRGLPTPSFRPLSLLFQNNFRTMTSVDEIAAQLKSGALRRRRLNNPSKCRAVAAIPRFVALSAGSNFCVLRDGEGQLWSMGVNFCAQHTRARAQSCLIRACVRGSENAWSRRARQRSSTTPS